MITKKRQGNALLIAILLSSLLILITVGLSSLVSSESRQISNLIRNGSAEYLAEGGNELGQLIFFNTENGQEKQYDTTYSLEIANEPASANQTKKEIKFALQSTSNHIPILEPEIHEQAIAGNKDLLFSRLLPGESIEVFLTDGTVDFELEYYVEGINQTALGEFKQADLDVLLLKVSGLQTESNKNEQKIDFITGYYPAGGSVTDSTNKGKSANSPAKIGTTDGSFNQGNFFKYSDGEDIKEYIAPTIEGGVVKFDEFIQETKQFKGFLGEHNQNAISITNAINLAVISSPSNTADLTNYNALREAIGSIYYRVCSPNCSSYKQEDTNGALVSPQATISSTGIFGSTSKNITSEISKPNAFSVFNFSIFQ
jgi:hypothetical protein